MVLVERGLADDAAAFHGVVLLGRGQRIGLGDLLHLHAGDEAGRGGGAQRVGVEARALRDAQRRRDDVALGLGQARRGAAPAEREGQGLVMLARRDEHGQLQRAAVGRGDLDHRVRRSSGRWRSARWACRRSCAGSSRCRAGRPNSPLGGVTLTPSLVAVFGLTSSALSHVSLVTVIGQFLQPAVVGVAAVVDVAEEEGQLVFVGVERARGCGERNG